MKNKNTLLALCSLLLLTACHKTPQPEKSLIERVQGQWLTECCIDNDQNLITYPNALGVTFGYHIAGTQLTVYQLRNNHAENIEAEATLVPTSDDQQLIAKVPVDDLTITMELRLQDKKLINTTHIRPDSHNTYRLKKRHFRLPPQNKAGKDKLPE